jgi:hypothetical protein
LDNPADNPTKFDGETCGCAPETRRAGDFKSFEMLFQTFHLRWHLFGRLERNPIGNVNDEFPHADSTE